MGSHGEGGQGAGLAESGERDGSIWDLEADRYDIQWPREYTYKGLASALNLLSEGDSTLTVTLPEGRVARRSWRGHPSADAFAYLLGSAESAVLDVTFHDTSLAHVELNTTSSAGNRWRTAGRAEEVVNRCLAALGKHKPKILLPLQVALSLAVFGAVIGLLALVPPVSPAERQFGGITVAASVAMIFACGGGLLGLRAKSLPGIGRRRYLRRIGAEPTVRARARRYFTWRPVDLTTLVVRFFLWVGGVASAAAFGALFLGK
jgi:hypothetical protein